MAMDTFDDFEPLRPTLLDTLGSGTWHAAAVSAALSLQIFELTNQPIGIEQAAEELDCSDRGIRALFCLLWSIGLLRRHGDLFSNTPTAKAFFYRASEAFCGDAFVQQNLLGEAGLVIAKAVQTGQPPTDLNSFRAADDAHFQELRTSLVCWPYTAKSADLMWRQVSERIRLGSRTRLLDVGCGNAVRTFALAQELTKLQIVCLDRRGALDVARRIADKMDVRAQAMLIEGDAGQLPFKEGSFDLAFAGSVLCLYGRDVAHAIVREVHQVLRPNGVLVIFGPAKGPDMSGNTALLDLQLLLTTMAGRCYAAPELEEIVKEEGFYSPDWIDLFTLLARRRP